MALDWTCGELLAGLDCYRNGLFFEAHEHWELAWLAASEPEKTFLQAIIQVAAGFHHLNRGNRVGAASLLGRALRRLESYPDEFGGVAVARLRQEIEGWLAALDEQDRVPGYPLIA